MRVLLLALGFALLAWGALDTLVPRPRARTWTPAPAEVADSTLSVVRIGFDRPLHASSYAYAQRLDGRSAPTPPSASHLDPADPDGRTLLLLLPGAGAGVYEVRWHARLPGLSFLPLGREGRYRFAIAARPSADSAPRQWDEDTLDPRHGADQRLWVLLSGAICLWVARRSRPRDAPAFTKG